MKPHYEAVFTLVPDADVRFAGTTYDGVIWVDPKQACTREAFDAKLAEIIARNEKQAQVDLANAEVLKHLSSLVKTLIETQVITKDALDPKLATAIDAKTVIETEPVKIAK